MLVGVRPLATGLGAAGGNVAKLVLWSPADRCPGSSPFSIWNASKPAALSGSRTPPLIQQDPIRLQLLRQGNITAEIIEKNFWVCWTLKHVFDLGSVPAQLIFKGETSLSKVYGVIDRFAEDIDRSLSREDLGFKAALLAVVVKQKR